ncbi:MAG TPA: DinB family protein, partial [Balneolales bacterium]|nr:DinB family protein [Balneolales bacterium]
DQQKKEVSDFFREMTDSQLNYRYAEDKWSIQDILKHIIDSEQVFAYRALCISRKEKISLPGFDQDSYVANSNADTLSKSDLLNEFLLLRAFNIQMFRNFDDKMWNLKGVANNLGLQVRAIPFIIAGHLDHHLQVINSKYL